MKRSFCLLLAAVMLLSCVGFLAPQATAAELTTSEKCINMLKEMEGLAKYPYWDYLQWTVGYGTKCPDEDLERYRRDGITEAEADQLLRSSIRGFEKSVNSFDSKYSLNLSQNQFDALILFCYNLGTGWMFSEGDFRFALINHKTGNDFIVAICRWSNAGGKVLPILVKRRLMEANMYLNGIYDKNPPSNYCYVLYDPQGGTTTETVQGYDTNLTAKILAEATYEGYYFQGWYTAPTGGTKVTVLDKSVGSCTLYARWGTEPAKEEEPAPSQPTQPVEPPVTEPPVTEPEQPPVSETKGQMGTVTGSDLRIRSGPGTGYSVLGYLNKGDRIEITEQKTLGSMVWGKMSKGWVCMTYVKLDSNDSGSGDTGSSGDNGNTGGSSGSGSAENPGVGGTINATDLRIRSGPGTGYSVVGYLNKGDRVVITEQKTVGSMTWGKMSKGWICMSYVKLDQTEEEEKTESVWGTVNVKEFLRIRKGPGTSYAIAGYLGPKDRVEILEQKTVGGTVWGRIDQGWISMDYVILDKAPENPGQTEPAPETPATKTMTVIADCLLIRKGPGTNHAIVGYLYTGAKVEVLETKTVNGRDWARISRGWVCMDYLK